MYTVPSSTAPEEDTTHKASLTCTWAGATLVRVGHACHLADALRDNSTLTVLRLQDNPLGERGAKALVESLPHNTNVKDLYLP